MSEILIGTCSWTDPTLLKSGRFYPSWANSAESRLQFYSSQFRIVEVDSIYYAMPSEKTSRLWVERTPANFIFDVKAFRLLTQHPTPAKALPADIARALPSVLSEKTNIYTRDLDRAVVEDLWQRFESALLPLDSAGKLGVVLFQFPPWFQPGTREQEYILSCKERLPQYRIAVEFRNNSWLSDANRERSLHFLRQNNLPFVCVDEPQGFKSSVPPVAEATSDIGLARFHGRNTESWEKQGIGPAERFKYLYSEDELRQWAPRIKSVASQTKQFHVLFNNCHEDKGIVNARQIGFMLD
jgi:uncharacterized protein YecE (DUF72 family)